MKFKNAAIGLAAVIFTITPSSLCAAGQAKEIKITARKFTFEPKTVTVRKGEPVKLVVTSEDVDHGLAISDFDIDVAVKAKETKAIEFTPDRAGKFRIYCSVFCGDGHPDMEGELVVTEGGASSNVQVTFDDNAPGVVIVEANGERLRIDTTTKTVARLSEATPAAAPPPATQPIVASEERERRPPSEPYDYRLVNVPTPKRVPKHSVNVHFTHRFSSPINEEGTTFTEQLEELFGLDSFSISSFGLSYGITDRLYANFYRSPISEPGLRKTIELGLGYHILDEAGRSPVALSAYASVEGNDNFSEEFTWNIQAMLARSVTKYADVFFSPAVHLNANGQGRFNPRLGEAFPLEPEAANFRLGQHTGSFGFGVNARVRPTVSLLFEFTPRVGFKLGRVEPVFSDDFTRILRFENNSEPEIGFGIEKRIGRHSFALTFSNTQTTTTSRYNSSNLALPPSKFIIGFNLFRRLY
ncbi:MAG TPA: DUF5777 family beta-barrel protein [Blastocatellia bacterium]|nr:DUF5777 family beta-barrel protein [Blastocatellia bacterium]